MFAVSIAIFEIFSRYLRDLDFDLLNVSRSGVNMPSERPHSTFCAGNNRVLFFCHRLRDIHVQTNRFTRFESDREMKVKDVDYLEVN